MYKREQNFSRHDRVKKEMIRAAAEAVRNIKDPRLAHKVVSVTDVDVAKDYSHARVYVSIFGDDAEKQALMEILEEHTPRLRTQVGHMLRLRHTTKLDFRLDESLERGTRVNELLKKIADESS